jgi:hypothetical protein
MIDDGQENENERKGKIPSLQRTKHSEIQTMHAFADI